LIIEISGAEKMETSIDLFNNMGIKVASISPFTLEAGNWKLMLKTEHLTNGAYILKCNIGEFIQSQLILIE